MLNKWHLYDFSGCGAACQRQRSAFINVNHPLESCEKFNCPLQAGSAPCRGASAKVVVSTHWRHILKNILQLRTEGRAFCVAEKLEKEAGASLACPSWAERRSGNSWATDPGAGLLLIDLIPGLVTYLTALDFSREAQFELTVLKDSGLDSSLIPVLNPCTRSFSLLSVIVTHPTMHSHWEIKQPPRRVMHNF